MQLAEAVITIDSRDVDALFPAEVVDEAWTAMLAGSPFVVLPKTVMLSEVLKGVIPIGLRDFIADHVIGVYHTMEDFTGRAPARS